MRRLVVWEQHVDLYNMNEGGYMDDKLIITFHEAALRLACVVDSWYADRWTKILVLYSSSWVIYVSRVVVHGSLSRSQRRTRIVEQRSYVKYFSIYMNKDLGFIFVILSSIFVLWSISQYTYTWTKISVSYLSSWVLYSFRVVRGSFVSLVSSYADRWTKIVREAFLNMHEQRSRFHIVSWVLYSSRSRRGTRIVEQWTKIVCEAFLNMNICAPIVRNLAYFYSIAPHYCKSCLPCSPSLFHCLDWK